MDSDTDRRMRDDEEERAYWEAQEEQDRKADESALAEAKKSAIDRMETWFFEQFEDPQNETPIDGEDQTYIYPWGGPFEAGDMLHGQFGSEFKEEWIIEAVEKVERDGIYEWAPNAHGDYYEHPAPDPEQGTDDQSTGEITKQILSRLNELEDVVRALRPTSPLMGHNYPPEEIGLPPYSGEDQTALVDAISDTRHELGSKEGASPRRLTYLAEIFSRFQKRLAPWLLKKADLFVDETIKATVKGGIVLDVVNLLGALSHDLFTLALRLATQP